MSASLGNSRFLDRLLPAPRKGGYRQADYWVWCGSPIRGDDGRYHLFASRWPRKYPFFLGYVTNSEVVRAVSDRPAGPYEFAELVLPARGRGFWDGMMTHNPCVLRYGSEYLLFYIGATYQGRKPTAEELWRLERGATNECYNSICIGLATAPSVTGPWTRRDEPVLRPRPGKWDGTVVTNPAPCVLSDGRLMMLYRSNTRDGLRLGAAIAADPTAPFARLSDQPVLASTKQSYVEDPYLWQQHGRLHLLAKDWTGGFTGEKGGG
ncbi:MAG: glycosyl hydrolase family 43, partial [Armatimonadetes bacterium]|nr:glycosyl hydrolase family 43 [Armatimonadota bacterium]